MAYKFQLGAAKLGGSIEAGAISGSALSSSAVEADTADKVIAAVADGEIPILKLAASTISGKSLGGNLDALSSGNGISMTNYDGSTAVSNLTIQRSGSLHALKLDAGGVAVLLSGSTGLAIDDGGLKLNAVPNASLANTGVTLTAGVGMAALGAVALGASITVGVDGVLEDLDTLGTASGDGEFIVATGAGAFAYESGATARDSLGLGTGSNVQFSNVTGVSGSFTGDMTISGDLTILGGVISASVTQLLIQDTLINVGDGQNNFAQDYGIQFGSDGSEWASIVTDSDAGFNNFSSSLPFLAPSFATNEWSITESHISGNLPVSASAFYGDGSNLQGVSATGVQMVSAKFDSGASATGSITNERYVIADSAAVAMLVNLPSIAPSAAGTMIIIKRVGGNNVTISAANSDQDIEGSDQDITLESDGAAVTLMATDEGDVNNGGWRIV